MARLVAFSLFLAALMVAGWGSLDFFSDVPRTAVLLCILGAPLFLAGNDMTKHGKEWGESKLEFLVLALLTIVGNIFFLPFFAGHSLFVISLPEPVRYLGLGLLFSGYLIRWVGVRTLKKQFSVFVTIQENHQLITTGIYSMIRHPVYLGTILSVIGLFLVFSSWYGFLFVLIYFMLLTHRMNQEEKLLLKHFGTVYQEYSSKSFRLIPHIY